MQKMLPLYTVLVDSEKILWVVIAQHPKSPHGGTVIQRVGGMRKNELAPSEYASGGIMSIVNPGPEDSFEEIEQ